MRGRARRAQGTICTARERGWHRFQGCAGYSIRPCRGLNQRMGRQPSRRARQRRAQCRMHLPLPARNQGSTCPRAAHHADHISRQARGSRQEDGRKWQRNQNRRFLVRDMTLFVALGLPSPASVLSCVFIQSQLVRQREDGSGGSSCSLLSSAPAPADQCYGSKSMLD